MRIFTVFKITPGGTLTTLHSFRQGTSYYPNAGLVQATDGNFYGTLRAPNKTWFPGNQSDDQAHLHSAEVTSWP